MGKIPLILHEIVIVQHLISCEKYDFQLRAQQSQNRLESENKNCFELSNDHCA